VTDRPSRTPRTLRHGLPWFVGALLLVSIGLPSVAALATVPVAPEVGFAHPLSTTENLTVNLTDRPSFSPQFLAVPAGSSVSLHLVNVGRYNHTFTLAKTSGARLPATLSPPEVDAFFAANGTLANLSLAPGDEGWANLTFNLSQGFDSFEFASVVPYQFQAGMWGFLNITSQAAGLELSETTTDSLAFVPNVLSASPTHYPLVIAVLVTNEGSFGHTFTMAPQSNVTLQPTNFTDYFEAHVPLVNQPVPAVPGGTAWANFTISAPGIYQYICEVAGHFSNGMFGFLYVGVPVPLPPAAPSTAIVDGWVLVGSALLLGIGVVLTAVTALAGRFPSRPNPPSGHA
jgi:uncharacterized cupredoxin-like copper-binding protein